MLCIWPPVCIDTPIHNTRAKGIFSEIIMKAVIFPFKFISPCRCCDIKGNSTSTIGTVFSVLTGGKHTLYAIFCPYTGYAIFVHNANLLLGTAENELTRTPDPIQLTRQVPDPKQPTRGQ